MLIQATKVGAANPSLFPTELVLKIKKTINSTGSTIYLRNGLSIDVTDTLASIYAQQSGGKSIGIVFVTEQQKPREDFSAAQRQIIIATEQIREVWPKSTGAKITLDNELSFFVTETVATIYAQQTAPAVQLGLVSLTRFSDSVNFLVYAEQISDITPAPTPTRSIVTRKSMIEAVEVSESVATIFAAIV